MNYEQWIKFSFDRPISEPQWYWGIDDNSDFLGDDLAICYMFWDLIPWVNGGTDTKVALAFFDIVEDILSLNHIACQESAIHGLGHVYREHSLRVENIIDGFLADNSKIRPDLKNYALHARKGEVQ